MFELVSVRCVAGVETIFDSMFLLNRRLVKCFSCLLVYRVKPRAQASSLSFTGEHPGSTGLTTRGGAAALVHWQPVLRRDTQVTNRGIIAVLIINYNLLKHFCQNPKYIGGAKLCMSS